MVTGLNNPSWKNKYITAEPFPADVHLNLYFGNNHGGFALLRKSTQVILQVSTYTVSDKNDPNFLIRELENLKVIPVSSSITFSNSPFTLLPASAIEEIDLAEVFHFNTGIVARKIKTDKVIAHPAAVVYNEYATDLFPFIKFFPALQIFHPASVFLEIGSRLAKTGGKNKVFLLLENNSLLLLLFKERELELCNSFQIKQPDDVLYYTMAVLNQYNLPGEMVEAFLFGEGFENLETILETLSPYILLKDVQKFPVIELPDGEPEIFKNHFLTSLQSVCVS